MKTHQVTFYVQLEPEYGRFLDHATGEKVISKVRAVGITQKRPEKPRPGTIAVKLSIEAPEAFFLPLRPAATIVLPEDLGVLSTPVEVAAIDDNEDQS